MLMAQADVLINTGSSFASLAAVLAKPSQIYISGPPKESFEIVRTGLPNRAAETYWLSGGFYISKTGRFVLNSTLDALQSAIQAQIRT